MSYLFADMHNGCPVLYERRGGGLLTLGEAWAAVNPGIANAGIYRENRDGTITLVARRGMNDEWRLRRNDGELRSRREHNLHRAQAARQRLRAA